MSAVPPTVSISVNRKEVRDTSFWVEVGENLSITCDAVGAKPPVNITWFIGKSSIHASTETILRADGITYNSTSTYVFTANYVEATNITCTAGFRSSDDRAARWNKSITIFPYELPTLSIIINGINVSDSSVVYVRKGEEINATCRAYGGIPDPVLRWEVDIFQAQNREDDFFNAGPEVTSSYTFVRDANITCVAMITNVTNEIRELRTIRIIAPPTYGTTVNYITTTSITSSVFRTADHSNDLNKNILHVLIAGVTIICACFLVFWVYIIAKKFRSRASTDMSVSPDRHLRDIDHLRMKTFNKALHRSLHNPPKLGLPDLPLDEEDKPPHSTESESNYNHYYSAVKEAASNKSVIYSEDEMCLIVNLKMGRIYNRWMGTITTPNETNKCVVLTTVTESILRKKKIHWDAFVKRALDLPKTNHLTNIEGIGIDKSLYLITEHFVCENLQQRLTVAVDLYADTTSFSPISLPEVMKHIAGILEGMEVLHSFGFLHPGLSTRKILLSKKGHCKLYEFCLAEDALNISSLKKIQLGLSLNHLSPEALFWNEYTQTSDVWSTANVLWEIISAGAPRFPTEREANPDDPIIVSRDTWPQKFMQIRNDLVFDCWLEDSTKRPSVQSLRSSFKRIFESLVESEDSLYEKPTTELYTPMNPATSTEKR